VGEWKSLARKRKAPEECMGATIGQGGMGGKAVSSSGFAAERSSARHEGEGGLAVKEAPMRGVGCRGRRRVGGEERRGKKGWQSEEVLRAGKETTLTIRFTCAGIRLRPRRRPHVRPPPPPPTRAPP
jgi:hypothetical protein